jgi:hypothetical protein
MDWFAAAQHNQVYASQVAGSCSAETREMQKIGGGGGRAYILIFHLRSVSMCARRLCPEQSRKRKVHA